MSGAVIPKQAESKRSRPLVKVEGNSGPVLVKETSLKIKVTEYSAKTSETAFITPVTAFSNLMDAVG